MVKDKQEDKNKGKSIYLEASVVKALDRVANKNERSFSWMVNRILKEKLGMVDEEMT